MRSFVSLSAALGFAMALAGCGQARSVAPSTVTGAAALSTYRSTPVSVTATDEKGATVSAAIGADARFSLSLSKGHTYRLGVVTAAGSVPIVFPRSSGKLDATFSLVTDGASLALGNVRYLAAVPAAGFKVQSAAPSQGSTGDCVDCVGDDQQTSCADGSTGGSGAGESSGGSSDTAEQANPSQEMAVGDQNAPDQAQGCDSQEGDSSNVQQEGQN